jgi:hypothetical protein
MPRDAAEGRVTAEGRVLPIALECQHDLYATVGRALNYHRIASAVPVFANFQHDKRTSRFTLHGKTK